MNGSDRHDSPQLRRQRPGMTYTTRTAARHLGLTRHTVKIYCTRYNVAVKHGRDWLLTDQDLDVIRDRRRNGVRRET